MFYILEISILFKAYQTLYKILSYYIEKVFYFLQSILLKNFVYFEWFFW